MNCDLLSLGLLTSNDKSSCPRDCCGAVCTKGAPSVDGCRGTKSLNWSSSHTKGASSGIQRVAARGVVRGGGGMRRGDCRIGNTVCAYLGKVDAAPALIALSGEHHRRKGVIPHELLPPARTHARMYTRTSAYSVTHCSGLLASFRPAHPPSQLCW
jgi:hypothetical protein